MILVLGIPIYQVIFASGVGTTLHGPMLLAAYLGYANGVGLIHLLQLVDAGSVPMLISVIIFM